MTDDSIVDVSGWVVRILEPGGSDANVWLIDPETDETALFKPVVAKAGRRQDEDWAEKAVEQIAELSVFRRLGSEWRPERANRA